MMRGTIVAMKQTIPVNSRNSVTAGELLCAWGRDAGTDKANKNRINERMTFPSNGRDRMHPGIPGLRRDKKYNLTWDMRPARRNIDGSPLRDRTFSSMAPSLLSRSGSMVSVFISPHDIIDIENEIG